MPPPDPPSPKPPRGLRAVLTKAIHSAQQGFSSDPRHQPRVVRRIRWWGLVVSCLPMIVFIVAVLTDIISHPTAGNRGTGGLMLSVFLTICLVACTNYLVERIQARAAAANFRICPNCGYSLAQLDESGTCPECGHAYTPAGLKQAWNA